MRVKFVKLFKSIKLVEVVEAVILVMPPLTFAAVQAVAQAYSVVHNVDTFMNVNQENQATAVEMKAIRNTQDNGFHGWDGVLPVLPHHEGQLVQGFSVEKTSHRGVSYTICHVLRGNGTIDVADP